MVAAAQGAAEVGAQLAAGVIAQRQPDFIDMAGLWPLGDAVHNAAEIAGAVQAGDRPTQDFDALQAVAFYKGFPILCKRSEVLLFHP